MSNGCYDEPRYHEKKILVLNGIAIAGTATSAANKVNVPLQTSIHVTGVSYASPLGGTSATARTMVVGKSLAGTGAVTSIASQAFTTHADNATADLTVTEADLAATDALVVTLTGTCGTAQIVDLMIEYYENFA
jgi:hypothetical protein